MERTSDDWATMPCTVRINRVDGSAPLSPAEEEFCFGSIFRFLRSDAGQAMCAEKRLEILDGLSDYLKEEFPHGADE